MSALGWFMVFGVAAVLLGALVTLLVKRSLDRRG